MEQFIVRNVEREVKMRLKARASAHGHSMEEEVRRILRDAVSGEMPSPVPLGTQFARCFRGAGLRGEIPEQRGQAPRPAKLMPSRD